MKAEFKTITPEIAKEILEKNHSNRTIRKSHVDRYARDMIAGKWQMNGEPIQIGENGTLKNGQHRLTAIIKTGIPVNMLVVTGVPEDVNTYDTGAKRSHVDLARFDGMDSSRANNTYIGACTFSIHVVHGEHVTTYSEVRDFIDKHGAVMDTAFSIFPKGKAKKGEAKTRVAPFISATFFALESGYNLEKIELFWRIVRTGLYDNPSQQAAIIFRNMILTDDLCFSSKPDRKRSGYACECALRDFAKGLERKKSYFDPKPVYSNTWKGDLDE